MIPERPFPGTESRAELHLFEHLRDEVSKDFVAFHHVAWLVPRRGAPPGQGETDFVIAHPRLGASVLEVKGGGIRHDATSGAWYSAGQAGENVIRDPFNQARTASHRLKDAMIQARAARNGELTVGYAVAFPDTHVDVAPLRPDAPREIVLDGRDLQSLEQRLEAVFGYWRTQPLGKPGLNVLESVLAKSFKLRAPLAVELAAQDRELMTLTEEQYRILDMLARQTRVAIAGCAGSGKTFIAAEKARRLAGQGFRALFLCYNLLLADHLRRGLAEVNRIDVYAFDELCETIVRESGYSLPRLGREDPMYWPRLRATFREAARVAEGRYDALIVDEGQDFDPEWWLPLQLLLADPDQSPLYIFLDDNQRIFPAPQGLPVAQAPVVLTVNCRNTQRIHSIVSRYYDGETITAKGPEGMTVEARLYRDSKDLLGQLDATVGEWIDKAELDPNDIALLTPRSKEKSALWRVERLGGIALTDEPSERGKILRSSVHRFKGLERKVVGVVEIDEASERELYVLYSRGSVYLHVFCPKASRLKLPPELSRRAREAPD